MRKKILAANWKMNLTHIEAESYMHTFLGEIGEVDDVEIVMIPPFTSIPVLAQISEKAPFIRIGAQNMYWERSGAYTGEISATMLRVLFVKYVVIGHSERRMLFGETDETVNRKVHSALEAGLRPIVCVGESTTQRDNDEVETVLRRQLELGLKDLSVKDAVEIVIAYEPVWAIGTGRTATPAQAEEAHRFIRSVLSKMFGTGPAERVRIQYGGSVKPDNAQELLRRSDIDGALIGGASLDPHSFAKIIRHAEAVLH
ncbi:MAG TPA: triose-phosphate isomerase [Chthoniobacterales bacterium]|jgi:triosephosphate isomerase|nr:triose-phosphate isomerase [Chthoniobacterales bacterium]